MDYICAFYRFHYTDRNFCTILTNPWSEKIRKTNATQKHFIINFRKKMDIIKRLHLRFFYYIVLICQSIVNPSFSVLQRKMWQKTVGWYRRKICSQDICCKIEILYKCLISSSFIYRFWVNQVSNLRYFFRSNWIRRVLWV